MAFFAAGHGPKIRSIRYKKTWRRKRPRLFNYRPGQRVRVPVPKAKKWRADSGRIPGRREGEAFAKSGAKDKIHGERGRDKKREAIGGDI